MKGAAKGDAISIVEAAYDLEGDTRAWLGRLLEAAAPRLNRGLGVSSSIYDARSGLDERSLVTYGTDERTVGPRLAAANANPDETRRMHVFVAPLATASQNLGLTEEEALVHPSYVKFLHPLGIRDFLGVVAHDPDGRTLVLSAPMPDARRPSKTEVALWGQVATHLAAGARLRRDLSGARQRDISEGAEAILVPSGVLKHAEPAAQGTAARESLRLAAKAIDRARSKARSNEDEALDLWQGLVSGRWSLVEQFDTDGRRFLVARRNDPQVSDPRALTLRERQVLAYTAMGHPLKLIGYALGLSVPAISASRTRAMRKLGLRTLAEVARLFSSIASLEGDEALRSGSLQASEGGGKRGA